MYVEISQSPGRFEFLKVMVLKTCTKQLASLSMVEDHLYRWNLVVDDKSVFMVNSVRHGVWEQGES